MNKEDFLNLPPSLALGIVFDILAGDLDHREAPKVPRPPKYDRKIFRRGGFQWASETDAEGLRFWRDRAVKSADGGGKYADADKKQAAALAWFIEWRDCFPLAVWSGTRDKDDATADAPGSQPKLRQNTKRAAPQTSNTFDGDDDPDDEDVPF